MLFKFVYKNLKDVTLIEYKEVDPGDNLLERAYNIAFKRSREITAFLGIETRLTIVEQARA